MQKVNISFDIHISDIVLPKSLHCLAHAFVLSINLYIYVKSHATRVASDRFDLQNNDQQYFAYIYTVDIAKQKTLCTRVLMQS